MGKSKHSDDDLSSKSSITSNNNCDSDVVNNTFQSNAYLKYCAPPKKDDSSSSNAGDNDSSYRANPLRLTEAQVIDYFKRNPLFLTDYIVENYDTGTLNRWANARKSVDSGSQLSQEPQRSRTRCQTIIPIAMQQAMLSFATGQKSEESETLEKKFEAIKEIATGVTADADILVIVKLLRECVMQSTHAESGCIFIADSDRINLSLIDTNSDETRRKIRKVYRIRDACVPACKAALDDEVIIVDFTDEVNKHYNRNYLPSDRINSIMAIPLTEEDGRLIAAVEVYRENGEVFQPEDVDIAEAYTQWVKTTLTFSSMYNSNIRHQSVNGFILKLAETVFTKISDVEEVMSDIVSYTKALVQSERSTLFLMNEGRTFLEARIIDSSDRKKIFIVPESQRKRFSLHQGIIGYVAQIGKILNLTDVKSHHRYDPLIDSTENYDAVSMMCAPIRVNNNIVGVLQVLNSIDGVFSKNSEQYFGTFALYCGVALHLSDMYQDNSIIKQQCKLTLELMSLHTQCSEAEVKALKNSPLPNYVSKIVSFQYSPWSVPHDQKIVHVIFMFQDLFGGSDRAKVQWLRFDINTFLRFALTVRKNYRAVPYHNWDHACAVSQAAYLIIRKCVRGRFALEEEIAMFIGALCHDIDHRGKTNKFMTDNQSPLADLYTTSTMEQHHFNLTAFILQREGQNIFQMLSSHRYRRILDLIKHCIIATDIQLHVEKTGKQLVAKLNEGPLDFSSPEIRSLLIANCMTACDLSAMYKPWNTQFTVVLIIMKEFWLEGDEEKKYGKTPIPMMDRDFRHMLPSSQVGFISFMCLPCFKVIARVFPEYQTAVEATTLNLKRWQALKDLDEATRMQKLAEMEVKIANRKTNLVTTPDNDKGRRQSFHFASSRLKAESIASSSDDSSSSATESD